ncbi:hypothetical protein AAG906_017611 [Vitis piasezkii]
MVSEHTWINIQRSPMASDSSSTLFPFNTMIHMVTITLSSSNYLLWKSQLLLLLESQGLLGHTPNSKHLAWKSTDYTRPVTAYALDFKALCDQLHAIGRPVNGTDKVHWFLRGLGPDFSSFSTAQMAQTPLYCFPDLVSKAESLENFQKSLESLTPSIIAFTASHGSSQHEDGSSHSRCGRGNGFSHEFSSHEQGHAQPTQGRQPPQCHFNRLDDHYADQCGQRYDQSQHDPSTHLAEAFNTLCSVSGYEASNWFLDIGASAHMTPAHSTLDQSTTYTTKDCVIRGNGASLPITHIEFTSNCFKAHLQTSSIHRHLSCPYTPAQNGHAERKHHLVTKTGLALLFHSHTSPHF